MARETAPAFQFYPKEFLSSSKVMAMSLTERGAYITLLSVQWLDGDLPQDAAGLARILGVSEQRFQKLWGGLLSACFVDRNGRLANERLERYRQELADYDAACARGGKASAAARKERYGTAQPVKPPSKSLRKRARSDHRSEPRSDAEVAPNTASASATASTSDPSDQRSAPHPVKEFLSLYEAEFEALIGHKPVFSNGRDASIAKRTIDQLGVEDAHALLKAFFASSDKFIQESGYGLNIFAGQLNKLIADRGRPKPVNGVPTLTTDELIMRANKAKYVPPSSR